MLKIRSCLWNRLSISQHGECFQHGCDVFAGKPVIPVSAFTDHGQKPTREQLAQMITRARSGKSCCRCEFSRGQCPAVHQRAQHGDTTGITDQRRCRSYLWLATHI
jgi:hypothetical protein